MDHDALIRYRDAFNQSLTLTHFGLRLDFPSPERLIVHLDEVRPEQRGGLGTQAINGGVLSAIFDLAIGSTGALIDPTRRVATIQLSMRFERPVTGDKIRAEAWIDRVAAHVIYAAAEIYNEQGEVCARCQGLVARSDK